MMANRYRWQKKFKEIHAISKPSWYCWVMVTHTHTHIYIWYRKISRPTYSCVAVSSVTAFNMQYRAICKLNIKIQTLITVVSFMFLRAIGDNKSHFRFQMHYTYYLFSTKVCYIILKKLFIYLCINLSDMRQILIISNVRDIIIIMIITLFIFFH